MRRRKRGSRASMRAMRDVGGDGGGLGLVAYHRLNVGLVK